MGRLVKFKDFLKRSKIPIELNDDETYKRVTIRIKHGGVSLRDTEVGKKIGTKKQFILKQGQFIVSKIDARYGAFGIAPNEVNNAIITGNFWAYDVDFNIIDIDWFNQFTNSQYFYDLCERASSGITHRKYLSEESFLNNEINLPSLDEQKEAIAYINNLKLTGNSISTEITHQLDLIKNLRQAFLREAMQGVLVNNETSDNKTGANLLAEIQAEKAQLVKEKKIKKPKPLAPIMEDEIPFDIPENWCFIKLGLLSEIGPRSKGESLQDAAFIPMPLINSKFNSHPEFSIRKWEEISKGFTHFQERDVIFAKITPCFENSKAGIVQKIPNNLGAGTTELYVLRENSFVKSEYLYYLVKSDEFLKKGKAIMKGVSGQQRITTEFVENYIVPLPPLEIQERIVAKLDELMSYCDALEEQVKQSQQTNALLLQQVLREALGA
ncbi:restriction endonuclease subunit S [Empedobacter falsenii]